MEKDIKNEKISKKKSVFSKLIEKLDKKMQEKAKSGKCCCSDSAEDKSCCS